jgi:hypothetical protein
VHSAAPPSKGAREPDSPFAALGALRDALTQRERDKENSST